MTKLDLPARPWPVRKSVTVRALLGTLLFLLCFAGIGSGLWFLAFPAARDILDQGGIWERGVAAEDAHLGGKLKTTNAILNSYELDVTWRVEGGAEHTERVEFTTLFGGPEPNDEFEVRYDPQAPERCALSWAVERSLNRWLTLLVGVATALFGIFGCLVALRGIWRHHRFLGRLGQSGHAVELEVTDYSPATSKKQPGAIVYRQPTVPKPSLDVGPVAAPKASEVAPLGQPADDEHGFARVKKQKRELFWTADDKSRVLAVVDGAVPQRPLLLHFYPFVVAEQERTNLRTSLARR
jgi:hypothetical protein